MLFIFRCWFKVQKEGLKLDEKNTRIKFVSETFDFEDETFDQPISLEEVKKDDAFYLSQEKTEKKQDIFIDKLTQIVLLQKAQGFWEMKPDILDLLFLNEEVVQKNIPKELEKFSHSWMTMIVLHYLQRNFSQKSGSWALIAQKAEEFLLEMDFNFSDYKDQIYAMLTSEEKAFLL